MLARPLPPDALCEIADKEEGVPVLWQRDEAVERWLRELFIEGSSEMRLLPFWNTDHQHLTLARIGVLWTNDMFRQAAGFERLGQAEIPRPPQGNAWTKSRGMFQLLNWFGELPDFIITLYAPWCESATDHDFLHLVEHEIYHCAQKRDGMGEPLTDDEGNPKWEIRPHCIEEFTPNIGRYGARDDGQKAFLQAGMMQPSLAHLFDLNGNFVG